MPEKIDVIVPVKGRKIDRDTARYLNESIGLFDEGELRILLERPTRTARANRYYWGAVLTPIRDRMQELGMQASTYALHTLFKRRYLTPRTEVVFGEDVTLEPTTTRLNQTEFFDYVEAIKNDEQVVALGIMFEDADEFDSYDIAE
jgi:hypothetical protein